MSNEIVSSRTFAVSRESLFDAFVDPVLLAAWWGPRGSVNEFAEFDLRVGGRWRFVMRAEDGTEYPMSKEFVEVEVPERIVLRHLGPGHRFEMVMTYARAGERRTELTWRMRFESAGEAERVRAVVTAANEQNFDRLEALLVEQGRIPPA